MDDSLGFWWLQFRRCHVSSILPPDQTCRVPETPAPKGVEEAKDKELLRFACDRRLSSLYSLHTLRTGSRAPHAAPADSRRRRHCSNACWGAAYLHAPQRWQPLRAPSWGWGCCRRFELSVLPPPPGPCARYQRCRRCMCPRSRNRNLQEGEKEVVEIQLVCQFTLLLLLLLTSSQQTPYH